MAQIWHLIRVASRVWLKCDSFWFSEILPSPCQLSGQAQRLL